MALQHPVRPAKVGTVFAGGDVAAVEHLRSLLAEYPPSLLAEYPPSSPSMALFRDGKPVYMLHRGDIERREAWEIAGLLTEAFERFCAPTRLCNEEWVGRPALGKPESAEPRGS
jgi:putative YphP/YqiW family bacilliredoxin